MLYRSNNCSSFNVHNFQGKSAVVGDIKEGNRDLSALDFFGDSSCSFGTKEPLDSTRKRLLGDHDNSALNPKRCKKKPPDNIKNSKQKYKIGRHNYGIVDNDVVGSNEGRVRDRMLGEDDDGEKVRDDGEDDRSDVGEDDDGEGGGDGESEDDKSDDGEDDSGDDDGEGGDDMKGCSDGIERDEDGGISLFRGQSLVPSRGERRKTNHKKRHSSKRKLEEIELRKQEVSTYSMCDAGTRDHSLLTLLPQLIKGLPG